MNAFLVEIENRPGALADIAEAIAAKGINIENVTGAAGQGGGRVALVTDDEPGTRAALGALGAAYTEVEIVVVSLRDEPGTLAGAARRLADAGINIEAIMPMGMSGGEVTVGFVTDDPTTAGRVLGDGGTIPQ